VLNLSPWSTDGWVDARANEMPMSEPTIVCPNCQIEIKLTESLAAPLLEVTRRSYEQKLARTEAEFAKRQALLNEREDEIAKAREAVDEQVATRLAQELAKLAADEARKAKLAMALEFDQKAKENLELQELLAQREVKLAEAQTAQAEVIRKERELEDARRELDLTIERRLQEGVALIREQARKDAEALLHLKVSEKEQTIASMQKQIEELKRRAEQGSEQLKGDVQEVELESVLTARFPLDTIDRVPKGEFGGDVFHRVCGPLGQTCGTILWESKRTRNWSDIWLAKLRGDQRTAKAEIAILVSHAMPKGVESFDLIDQVWVVHPRVMLPVAAILRQSLIDLRSARQATEGQHTKTEMIYEYLTGPRFRQRVEAIVEAFSLMKEDLDREKKAIMKQWAKRDEQINRVMQATVGMYGDLQGIAGKTLQEIQGLSLPLLESSTDDTMDDV
jgi:hypothetical protein